MPTPRKQGTKPYKRSNKESEVSTGSKALTSPLHSSANRSDEPSVSVGPTTEEIPAINGITSSSSDHPAADSHTIQLHNFFSQGLQTTISGHTKQQWLITIDDEEASLRYRMKQRVANLSGNIEGERVAHEINLDDNFYVLFPGDSKMLPDNGLPTSKDILGMYESLLPKLNFRPDPPPPAQVTSPLALMRSLSISHHPTSAEGTMPLPLFAMQQPQSINHSSKHMSFLTSDEITKLSPAEVSGSLLSSSSPANPPKGALAGLTGIPSKPSNHTIVQRLSALLLVYSQRLMGLFDHKMAAGAERHRLLLMRKRYQKEGQPNLDLPFDDDVFLIASDDQDVDDGDLIERDSSAEDPLTQTKPRTVSSNTYLQFAVTFADEWREMASTVCPELASPLEALGPLFSFISAQVMAAHGRYCYERSIAQQVAKLQSELDRSGIARQKAQAASEISKLKAKIAELEKLNIVRQESLTIKKSLDEISPSGTKDTKPDDAYFPANQKDINSVSNVNDGGNDEEDTHNKCESTTEIHELSAVQSAAEVLKHQQDVIEHLQDQLAALRAGTMKTIENNACEKNQIPKYKKHTQTNIVTFAAFGTQTDFSENSGEGGDGPTASSNLSQPAKSILSPLSPPIVVELPAPQPRPLVLQQPNFQSSITPGHPLSRTLQGIYEQQQRMYSDSVAALNSCSASQQDTATASSSVRSHAMKPQHSSGQHIRYNHQSSHTTAGYGSRLSSGTLANPLNKSPHRPSHTHEFLNYGTSGIERQSSEVGETSRHSLSENSHLAASHSTGAKSLATSLSAGRLLTPNTSREVIAQGVVTSVLYSAGVPVAKDETMSGEHATLVRPEESIEALTNAYNPQTSDMDIIPTVGTAPAIPVDEGKVARPTVPSTSKVPPIKELEQSTSLLQNESSFYRHYVSSPLHIAPSATLLSRAIASRERVATALPHNPQELAPSQSPTEKGSKTSNPLAPCELGSPTQPLASHETTKEEMSSLFASIAPLPVPVATLEGLHKPRGVLKVEPTSAERVKELNTIKVHGSRPIGAKVPETLQVIGNMSQLSSLSLRPAPPPIRNMLTSTNNSPQSGRTLTFGQSPRTARDHATASAAALGSLSAGNTPRGHEKTTNVNTEWRTFWEEKDRKDKEKERLEILALEKKLLQLTLAKQQSSSESQKYQALQAEQQTRQKIRDALRNFNINKARGNTQAISIESIMSNGKASENKSEKSHVPELPQLPSPRNVNNVSLDKLASSSSPNAKTDYFTPLPPIDSLQNTTKQPNRPAVISAFAQESSPSANPMFKIVSSESPNSFVSPLFVRHQTDWAKVAGGDPLAVAQYMAYLDSIGADVPK